LAQKNIVQVQKNGGRSRSPAEFLTQKGQDAIMLGHKPVWDGKFCKCENPGCACRGFANHHKGISGGNIFNVDCVSVAAAKRKETFPSSRRGTSTFNLWRS